MVTVATSTQLKLKNMYFGHIDAKHELQNDTPEERDNFKKSFLVPNNFDIIKFQDGQRYFIYGLKGTGKTALLRYIGLNEEDENYHVTSYILFKSEFAEEDKDDFSKVANYNVIEFETRTDQALDFEQVWKWFLHRHITEKILESDVPLFEENG